jgi:citrate synthase
MTASGLEGVVAFETEIAEPDREGGALRYRGVDIEELVGVVPFERVWGLLVGGPELEPATSVPPRAGVDPRGDLQAALALFASPPLVDLDVDEAHAELARASALAIAFTAGGVGSGDSLAERFLTAWAGEADPERVAALDAYWVTAAEHGMNASTFTARVVASTGADVGAALSAAVGALSGPLHGGAPARVLKMLDEVEREGDAARYVARLLDRGERLMGFGHRVYRAEDPRARVLRRTARGLGSARLEVAEALERAALDELAARKPDRVLATNVEFWSAVILDRAGVPAELFTPLFACARTAGWSAHILEQKRSGRLIRPTARYVGGTP